MTINPENPSLRFPFAFRQAFRPVYKNINSESLSTPDIVYINSTHHPESELEVVFWHDVLKVLGDALYVQDKFTQTQLIEDVDKKIYKPLRLNVAQDIILDVIIENPLDRIINTNSVNEVMDVGNNDGDSSLNENNDDTQLADTSYSPPTVNTTNQTNNVSRSSEENEPIFS
ncbi:hypothetical protein BGZ76_009739 [Entomortierella beljakovae]|nr:hypothetical protein BGZ76_009739 [Entomortierella beljakovae]